MRFSLAACDWMQERVLPELRLVMRGLTAKSIHIAGIVPSRVPTAGYDAGTDSAS
jgi:hypothetical protein